MRIISFITAAVLFLARALRRFFGSRGIPKVADITHYQRSRFSGAAAIAEGKADVTAGIARVALEYDTGSASRAVQSRFAFQSLNHIYQGFMGLSFPVAVSVHIDDPAIAPVETVGAHHAVCAGT